MAASEPIAVFETVLEKCELWPDRVVIDRTALLGRIHRSAMGRKEIYLERLAAIKVHQPRYADLEGYLQFVPSGGSDDRLHISEAKDNENCVVFRRHRFREAANFRDLVEAQIEKLRASATSNRESPPSTAAPPRVSIADELNKLAALRDSGVLTPEEFAAMKARLLERA